MSNPLHRLRAVIDNWASSQVVRVALFGSSMAHEEWDALLTSAYTDLRPRIVKVWRVREADVLVIHGPLTPLSWQALHRWLANRPTPQTPLMAVGPELVLNEQGFLRGPTGEWSEVQVSHWLADHPPAPRDLWKAVSCALESRHV